MKLSIDAVVRATAAEFQVSAAELRGDSRARRVVIPRHAVFLLAYEFTGASTTVIGRVFGDRDHTTVVSGMRTLRDRMAYYPDLNVRIAKLRADLARRIGEEPPNQTELAVIGLCADLSRALVARAKRGGVTPERLSELLLRVESWS